MLKRAGDYLRFARDLRVPLDNNEAERVIRMSKLRIKVSGCMRSMAGAETFCTIRSYLATAARHGISALDALILAAQHTLSSPATRNAHPYPQPATQRTPGTTTAAEPIQYPQAVLTVNVPAFCSKLICQVEKSVQSSSQQTNHKRSRHSDGRPMPRE